MASAQAMEEELQQSVLLSEGVESDATESFADNASRLHARRARRGDGESVKSGPPLHQDYGMENHVNVIDGHMSDQDASGEEIDQDMAGEEDKDALVHQIVVGHVSAADDMDEEEDEPGQGKEGRGGVEDEDEDMEEQEEEQEEDGGLEEGGQGVQAGKGVQGEEGDEQVEQGQDDEEEEDDDGQDEDEDEDEDDDMDTQEQYAQGEDQDGDDEGVGAVKIKPGESESEQEDGESVVSDIEDESDEDGGAWEEGEGADEDDESDAAVGNTCIFCKQDEENDPSEDFEAFLTCKGCSENAHQQCARDAAAMSPQNTSNAWRCPECVTGESDVDADLEMQEVDSCANKEETQSTAQPSDAWARQKRESEEGAVDKGGMEGARILRKRKTSSAEPDDAGGSVRKRRRNQSSESTQEADGPGEAARSSRASRLKVSRRRLAQVEKRSRTSLVVRMEVRPGNLKEILSRKKRQRRPAASLQSTRLAAGGGLLPTPFTTDIYSQPFYSLFDKETDDAKGKPYGGILSEAEADTSKTMPAADDRKRFDEAKQKAEDEWRARVLAMQAEADVPVRKAKKANDKASQIECIEFGGWEIDTWYAAPYPAEYSRNRVLYICEFCLKYMNSDYVAWRHKLKCAAKHPPGDEIYRHGSVSIFEVDGRKHPVYCQNLCLLAKLFLGSKTLYYDVEPFLFYILCEYDERGYHFVGYFSKEKRASSQNNVSCILTLPIHQRKGYGNLLIDFSYLLTRVEHKTGSPEKPLSDMGLVSYRNYWRLELCRYFVNVVDSGAAKQGLSVKRISDDTGMTPDDVVSALEGLRALVRDPHTKLYAFRLDVDYFRHYVAKWESKGYQCRQL
ncbi:hypothetical protein CDD82_6444 [Ophiocordyceps australis]|uniref:Histone acetyltransferase n=1 Tax=Ophiocordyceps australis TaxID=1399860 RepID=A0A2C5YWY7_9HYPO|nr:hypothetical protein CDD82_6444 [Ophiocordyceps australis]